MTTDLPRTGAPWPDAGLPRASRIAFGGDYNPEQWPVQVQLQDQELFDLAHVDTVTLGVFDWVLTQPGPDRYDFTVLDEVVQRSARAGRRICLATGTGAHPAWLARAHPEVTRVDFEGRKHKFGQRHNSCPTSPVFRRSSAAMAGHLARRYAHEPAVVAWHVGNEYGGACYCDSCTRGFRAWLRRRYGTLERLNEAWCATFWSHRFLDWDEIEAPSALTEHWRGPFHTAFQGISLDYLRFMSEAMLECFRAEKDAIREHSALPVTTNFMGAYQPIDYHRWADDLDFVSWDNYPPSDTAHVEAALAHDLMRGLKGGRPFWLMEQTPSTTACRDVNPLKRPGELRRWSWQAVAHGADAVLFFQMRASRGACEKYHGAVIGHAGRSDTRVFEEVAALGAELRTALGPATLGARTPARTALLFDWDSWWALELQDGPNRHLRYKDVVTSWYRAAWTAGTDVDVVPTTQCLDAYDVVLAPVLHLVKGDLAARLEQVAARGGSVVTSFLSGRADEDDLAFLADVPGPLGALTGVRVDEWDARGPEVVNPVTFTAADGTAPFTCGSHLVFEIVARTTADVVATYGADFYAGTPAVTRHAFGAGHGWYVAGHLDQAGVDHVVHQVLDHHGLLGPWADVPDVETTLRRSPDGTEHRFVISYAAGPLVVPACCDGTDLLTGTAWVRGCDVELAPGGVHVVRVAGTGPA